MNEGGPNVCRRSPRLPTLREQSWNTLHQRCHAQLPLDIPANLACVSDSTDLTWKGGLTCAIICIMAIWKGVNQFIHFPFVSGGTLVSNKRSTSNSQSNIRGVLKGAPFHMHSHLCKAEHCSTDESGQEDLPRHQFRLRQGDVCHSERKCRRLAHKVDVLRYVNRILKMKIV